MSNMGTSYDSFLCCSRLLVCLFACVFVLLLCFFPVDIIFGVCLFDSLIDFCVLCPCVCVLCFQAVMQITTSEKGWQTDLRQDCLFGLPLFACLFVCLCACLFVLVCLACLCLFVRLFICLFVFQGDPRCSGVHAGASFVCLFVCFCLFLVLSN